MFLKFFDNHKVNKSKSMKTADCNDIITYNENLAKFSRRAFHVDH